MANIMRPFLDFVARRLMGFGGDIPVTEDVQTCILLMQQDHGKIEVGKLVDLFYSNHSKDRMVREVLQAAQILVNQGQLSAFNDDKSIDPVYGDERTILKAPDFAMV